MSEVTIQISGHKPEKEELAEELAGLKQALEEVKLIKEGKLKAKTIEELLREID